MTERGWKRRFDVPIPLSRGRHFVTLEEAGTYVTKLPKAEHDAVEWQAAMEALILIADLGGRTIFAPSTWAMMILGFAGVAFMAYCRRNDRSPVSIKVKDRKHPALDRVKEAFSGTAYAAR